MKKFLYEYKALRSKSESEKFKNGNKGEAPEEMGVFKWLRRERVTVTTQHLSPVPSSEDRHSQSLTQVGTIRTEEYKRDLAEFQARRSVGGKDDEYKKDLLEFQARRSAGKCDNDEYNRNLAEFQARREKDDKYKRDLAEFRSRRSFDSKDKDKLTLPDTPVKRKCGRHSLPVSCTDCTGSRDHDNTFNYEKKSATKYKKKYQKRAKSASPEENGHIGNIQFLFQNQVFMPGNMFASSATAYAEPKKARQQPRMPQTSPEFTAQRHIDFKEDQQTSSPLFYKNNSLPYDSQQFLNSKGWDDCDGSPKDQKDASNSSSDTVADSPTRLLEVMRELRRFDQWADDQLDNGDSQHKSDTSVYGLPVASASELDMTLDGNRTWHRGAWGLVPVQVKPAGATLDAVQRRMCEEVNILRKCRHPNIILLMGLYQDVHSTAHLICEECVDTLYGILHVQGRVLSAQTAVHYCLDIANALVYLRMHGYIHIEVTSHSIMVTSHDAAKLADLTACERLPIGKEQAGQKEYVMYTPEPQYVNIEDTRETPTLESEPLLSVHSSETYLETNAITKEISRYNASEHYRWHAPELFEADARGMVRPCAKSTVYSLCLVLWEACNAAVPWKTLTYEKLHELYTLWKTGIRLPQDGTYPGSLLAAMQGGLKLDRAERMDLIELQNTLQSVKRKIDDLEYIIIPARLPKKRSNFSITGWEGTTDESECQSPGANIDRQAAHDQHRTDSPSTSDKETKEGSDSSRPYETIAKQKFHATFTTAEKCYLSDDNDDKPLLDLNLKYKLLPENDFSSACSTPISKIRARIKDIGTPGALHRSDSTEYCSIMSPEGRNFTLNNTTQLNNTVDPSAEKSAKLSCSFTPKSYKPLHIKVSQCNLDSVKSILKDQSGSEKSSYKFDIKNYSLPTTPIARSNKLRKNAWLSGDIGKEEKSVGCKAPENHDKKTQTQSAPETPAANHCFDKDLVSENGFSTKPSYGTEDRSPESVDVNRDCFTSLRRIDRPSDYSPETDDVTKTNWSYKSSIDSVKPKSKLEEDALANVNVKPLVAIHERWIYEANRKTGRAMSVPDDNRCHINAVKPASHCVDTTQKSLPHLSLKRSVSTNRSFRAHPVSPGSSMKNGGHWEQFCQARDAVAKNVNFSPRANDTGAVNEELKSSTQKIDQATDTRSIEEFIRELIRKEFQTLVHEISDDGNSSLLARKEESFNNKISNIVEHLNGEEDECAKKDNILKSFSRVRINGNNKPLLQITFSRTGENSLQVLDNCVNVTICDSGTSGKEKLNLSFEETLTEDAPHLLKRCQAFNALQDARSTEDLYIDDDLSTQLQENFGGRVKLIPLHGSLHEILCEREDDCCLIKVKQENGCDSIYFKCDNSDTESRDAIDGIDGQPQDTVVFKRSISLVEERIQRVFPKNSHRPNTVVRKRVETTTKARPKSEVLLPKLNANTRVISSSSPSLMMKDQEEVEVNLENTMCYQDSSSEECLRCQTDSDDFELLEKTIEDDIAKTDYCVHSNTSPVVSGCLAKISEENLSTVNDDGLGNDLKSSRETI